MAPDTVPAGNGHQGLRGLGDGGGFGDGGGDPGAAAASELQDAFFAQLPVGGENGVAIDRQGDGEFGRGRELFTDGEFSRGDTPAHARDDLERQGLPRRMIDCPSHGASIISTIV